MYDDDHSEFGVCPDLDASIERIDANGRGTTLCRDRQLLDTMTLQCDECQRTGGARDHKWNLIPAAPGQEAVVLCDECRLSEPHG